jgi:anti-sigma factor ChrR (cupin superfamily)
MPVVTTVREITQDLVRFLLRRVDEDDAQLKRLARRSADGDGVQAVGRLQVEAAAKRKLIGCMQQLLVLRDQPAEKAVREQAGQMLRTLALPYQDHPDYRREWRPSGSH